MVFMEVESMSETLLEEEIYYQNLLENLTFLDEKPNIQALSGFENAQFKKISLKAENELKCHKTNQNVTIVWLRGKAKFTAFNEEFIMHPGSLLSMPPGTPHGAIAETDCIFLVVKIA